MTTTQTPAGQGSRPLVESHPANRTGPAANSGQLDKETYRRIIEAYFKAFETHDFSKVQFSQNVEFLPPISRLALKGREEIESFVEPVSSRVLAVQVLNVNVDFPTASGLWQITTTKGAQYTVHNFFRLDDEGLLYIWPVIDPFVTINDPLGVVEWLTGNGY
ncbi:DUF4904 domain-containing protein [Kibdelosporangium persicum]|uniref:DUF4904 domain-containing protein n=1 Tax=Kibdelosporangium persicum TaxID=2698649 RepID=A0ABX2FHJ2_9PSEU|nr:DUF4904 domain-containing protein [Kibdelosporangium persicum]NRN70352.1 hypothetical protein [Kibdelosporangium persicum]